MKDGLMSHLKETATPPKRVDQVRLGSSTCMTVQHVIKTGSAIFVGGGGGGV